ncbi:MAG: hypothetical protein JKX85_09865 [Phycisphaeraceae bacterium]|nr:hypothetical protein [Phycisphaeraceae bacterium]
MKRSMLLGCVLCLSLINLSHADELSDLRAANAQLKTENQQLKQRISELQHSNRQIKEESQKVQQQKHALYLKTTPQADGSKTLTSYSRQLPLTRGKLRHSSYQLTATVSGKVSSPITLTIFAAMSPGMFRRAKALNLEIDGVKLNIPITKYHSKKRRASAGSRTGVNLFDETVTLKLTTKQISLIAKANQVTGTLGLAQLALGREDYNLFIMLNESVNANQ